MALLQISVTTLDGQDLSAYPSAKDYLDIEAEFGADWAESQTAQYKFAWNVFTARGLTSLDFDSWLATVGPIVGAGDPGKDLTTTTPPSSA